MDNAHNQSWINTDTNDVYTTDTCTDHLQCCSKKDWLHTLVNYFTESHAINDSIWLNNGVEASRFVLIAQLIHLQFSQSLLDRVKEGGEMQTFSYIQPLKRISWEEWQMISHRLVQTSCTYSTMTSCLDVAINRKEILNCNKG